jgi:hypothetical protein
MEDPALLINQTGFYHQWTIEFSETLSRRLVTSPVSFYAVFCLLVKF